MENREVEVRFLEIDKEALVRKLLEVGAKDLGDNILEEIIFYDPELKWRTENKFVRIRKSGEKIKMTYKHNREQTIDSTIEIELEINDIKKAEAFLEKMNLQAFRHQQKKRHTFELDGTTIDIDTWPKIPTYVEIEGNSEGQIKEVSEKLGLDWRKVVFEDAGSVIENIYKIPVKSMRWFTFDRFE